MSNNTQIAELNRGQILRMGKKTLLGLEINNRPAIIRGNTVSVIYCNSL